MSSEVHEHGSPQAAGPSGDADALVLPDSTYPGEVELRIETTKFHSPQMVCADNPS